MEIESEVTNLQPCSLFGTTMSHVIDQNNNNNNYYYNYALLPTYYIINFTMNLEIMV